MAAKRKRRHPKHGGELSKQAIKKVTRGNEAVDLRTKGLTLRAIAQEMHVSAATVYSLIRDTLAQIPVENVKELRAVETEKLDASESRLLKLIDTFGALAEQGDDKAANIVCQAETRLSAVRMQRAKLLGANAPEVVSVEHSATERPADAARVMSELFGGKVTAPTVIDMVEVKQLKP